MPENLLTVIATELGDRGWHPGVTEAGQVLWTKGRYAALMDTQAITVQCRIEAGDEDAIALSCEQPDRP